MLRTRSISLATLVILLLVASLGAGSAAAAPEPPAPDIQGEYAEGQLIVGFEESFPREAKNGAHRALGASVEQSLGRTKADLVKLPSGKSVETAIEEYSNQPGVIYAEPDYILRADGTTPDDPRFDDQWALRNTGQTYGGAAGTPDADIDASESGGTADAWSLTTGSPDVVVAVIDSGIDFGHPDLGPNKWVNPAEVAGNGVDDDRNGLIDDLNGWDFAHGDSSVYDVGEVCPNQPTVHNDDHGTHVAGIIGARGNNGVGISGVAWKVKLMSLKFLAVSSGECGVGKTSQAIMAIDYAIHKGADVINASWGGTANSSALQTALTEAGAAGIVVATAAGNSNQNLATSPDYPSSFNLPGQIVVAASNRFDQKASVSNYGGATDVAAPGELIVSTVVTNNNGTVRSTPYKYYTGTSMATPMVSGAIALLKSYYPLASASELIERLYSTVDVKPAFAGGVTATGGRINLKRALRGDDPPAVPEGYWLVASDGGIFTFGSLPFYGSTGAMTLNQPIVGMAAHPSGNGYWLVAADGGIFTFGNIPFYGSTGAMTLRSPIVGMAAHPSGRGYWLVAADGGIFTFGSIPFYGSTGALNLRSPIVGMAVHPTGNGYWLVASDGGIFTFGSIPYYGSTGALTLRQPIKGMAVHPSGSGYWLVASDGGIFTFGSIPYYGSTGAMTLRQPIVDMSAHPSGSGYWLVAADGGVFTFGNIPYYGSTGHLTLRQPIVGMSGGRAA